MVVILKRALRLMLTPAAEWRSIAVQPATPREVFTYAAVLALIPSVASFIGYSVVGIALGFVSHRLRMPIAWGLETAIFIYVVWLAWVYVTALIVAELAPRFQGRADFIDGLKLAAHAPTAFWLAAIFMLVPSAGAVLSLLGLYSVYTMAVGLPIVTRCPPDESTWFIIAIGFCYLIIAGAVALLEFVVFPGFGVA